MSTNKPIIVPVHLDSLPLELPPGSSPQQKIEPTCVIKTAAVEISFFNGVDAHLVQTVLKGLVLK